MIYKAWSSLHVSFLQTCMLCCDLVSILSHSTLYIIIIIITLVLCYTHQIAKTILGQVWSFNSFHSVMMFIRSQLNKGHQKTSWKFRRTIRERTRDYLPAPVGKYAAAHASSSRAATK